MDNKIYVLAGNYSQFKYFINQMNDPKIEFAYIKDVCTLKGARIRKENIAYYGTYYARSDYIELKLLLEQLR